jgi:hypothetical protein
MLCSYFDDVAKVSCKQPASPNCKPKEHAFDESVDPTVTRPNYAQEGIDDQRYCDKLLHVNSSRKVLLKNWEDTPQHAGFTITPVFISIWPTDKVSRFVPPTVAAGARVKLSSLDRFADCFCPRQIFAKVKAMHGNRECFDGCNFVLHFDELFQLR